MKLQKLKINKDYSKQVGLGEIDLTKKNLGHIVAFIGKNGAGKTRILELLNKYFAVLDDESIFLNHLVDAKLIENENYKSLNKSFKLLYQQVVLNKSKDPNQQATYKRVKTQLLNLMMVQLKRHIIFIKSETLAQIKNTVKDAVSFERVANSVKEKGSYGEGDDNEFSVIGSVSSIEYIVKLATGIIVKEHNLYIKSKKQKIDIDKELSKEEGHINFHLFNEYFKIFFDDELVYEALENSDKYSAIVKYKGIPLDLSKLSPGEKTLFSYVLIFYLYKLNNDYDIKRSMVLIDEPELHLHPEAQIKLIDRLSEVLKDNGQLWISTHSVHILSHLDHDQIFPVKNGNVEDPGRLKPYEVLKELVELNENTINELSSFLSSTSSWAYNNFVCQCFKDPETILDINPNDAQYNLFKGFIAKNDSIKLLDYGAGKGRLGYIINEDQLVSDKIRYFTYEKYNHEDADLRNTPKVEAIYPASKQIPTNVFHYVIMCNVLHEINPNEWLENLEIIKEALSEDGKLIIIEDKFLPKGECAHEFGYLIMGEQDLAMMFKQHNEFDTSKILDKNIGERMVFYVIDKKNIRIDEDMIFRGISSLQKSIYSLIKNFKFSQSGKNDLSNGRLLANYSQLYINATIYLDTLNDTESITPTLE